MKAVSCAAVLLAVFAATALAQPQVQRFDLHKPINEAVYVCTNADAAIALVTALIAGGPAASNAANAAAERAGECGELPILPVTYKKQIFRGEFRGVPVTVYEAAINGIPAFIPLLGFLHNETEV